MCRVLCVALVAANACGTAHREVPDLDAARDGDAGRDADRDADVDGDSDGAADTGPDGDRDGGRDAETDADLAGDADNDDSCDNDGDGYAGAACGGDDCNDEDPWVHPGATEICLSGVDEDCDGTLDPVLVLTTAPLDLNRQGHGPSSVVETAPGEFALAWGTAYDDVMLDRVAPSLALRRTRVGGPGGAAGIALAWTGAAYGVTWTRQIYLDYLLRFAHVEASGRTFSEATLFSADDGSTTHPLLEWIGDGFGLVCVQGDSIRLVQLATDGGPVGRSPAIAVPGHSSSDGIEDLAWLASLRRYGLTVEVLEGSSGLRSAYVVLLDEAGAVLAAAQRLGHATGATLRPVVAAGPDGFGVAYGEQSEGSSTIYFQPMDADGALGDPILIDSGLEPGAWPTIDWDRSGYVIAWSTLAAVNITRVTLRHDRWELGTWQTIADGDGTWLSPRLAAADGYYALGAVRTAVHDGPWVYFAVSRCLE